MKIDSRTPSLVSTFVATLLLAAAHCMAQGVIGGNQNGLGPGGYLPKPPVTVLPPVYSPSSIKTSLAVPGYGFELVEISGQPVRVVIDGRQPVMVPLAATSEKSTALSSSIPAFLGPPVAAPRGPGFLATFELDNNSAYNRVFKFVDRYYADIKIIFSVLNGDGVVIWQSYQIQVDIPPFAPKVNLVLGAHSNWQKTVFVPLYDPITKKLLDPGQYTLQAQVIGTPNYSASAPFEVSTLVGGPIIPILPGVSKVK